MQNECSDITSRGCKQKQRGVSSQLQSRWHCPLTLNWGEVEWVRSTLGCSFLARCALVQIIMLAIRTQSVFTPNKADMLLKVCSNTMAPGGGGGGGNAKKLPFGGGGGPHVSFSDLPPDMLKLIVEQVFEGDVKSTRLARRCDCIYRCE